MASKIHSKFNLRNKISEIFVILPISILLYGNQLHHLILLHIWCEISLLMCLVVGASTLVTLNMILAVYVTGFEINILEISKFLKCV